MVSRDGGDSAAADALIASFPEGVAATCNALRQLMREAMPGSIERVYGGWKAFGYHDPELGYLCGIFRRTADLRLIFEHGVSMVDAEGLFDGGGTQTRHITIRGGEDIPGEGIRALVTEAIREATIRKAYGRG